MVTTKTLTAAAALTAALLASGCGSTEAPPPQTSTAAPTISSAPPRGTNAPDTTTTTTSTTPSSNTTPSEGRATTEPAKATGTPRGPLPQVDRLDGRNAAAVAAAYVQTIETIDTRIDRSRSDAQRRAMRWLIPELANEVENGLSGGAGWSTLTKKGAWTKATVTDVTPSGADPTKGLTADRVIQVEVTTYGRDHKTIGQPTTSTVAVTLQRATESKPWRVAGMQTY